MAKFQNKYRIEPNRWQFWDYSSPGRYFITICVVNRACIFGYITNGKMNFSEYGDIVDTEIRRIPEYNKRVILDAWVVMPNHIHCIITLGDYDFDNVKCAINDAGDSQCPDLEKQICGFSSSPNIPLSMCDIKEYRKLRRKMLISKIVGKMQQQSSKQINILRNTPGAQNWQPNYHDHVIRSDDSFHRIKEYIINNPKNWEEDTFFEI